VTLAGQDQLFIRSGRGSCRASP